MGKAYEKKGKLSSFENNPERRGPLEKREENIRALLHRESLTTGRGWLVRNGNTSPKNGRGGVLPKRKRDKETKEHDEKERKTKSMVSLGPWVMTKEQWGKQQVRGAPRETFEEEKKVGRDRWGFESSCARGGGRSRRKLTR